MDDQENNRPLPYLPPEVLQKVFDFSGDVTDISTFLAYRLVSKTWNLGMILNIRNNLPIQWSRTVTPYPNGFELPESMEAQFFDENISVGSLSFQNVVVTGANCEALNNPDLISWMEARGKILTGLQLLCPLTCLDQTQFVEKVLRNWCPNLVTLHLSGVQSISSLLHISEFSDPADLCCAKLKKVVFSVVRPVDNNWEKVGYWKPCSRHIFHITEYGQRYARLYNLLYFPPLTGPEWDVLQMVGIKVQVSGDGGILGKILSGTSLQQVIIKEPPGLTHCATNLIRFCVFRQSAWKGKLQYVELPDQRNHVDNAELERLAASIGLPLTINYEN